MRSVLTFNPRLILIAIMIFFAPAAVYAEKFISLTYHHISQKPDGDKYAVTLESFIEQMEYLGTHNYHPVSIDDLLASANGEKKLPENPILLTVDDGLLSFYQRIFPVIKLYQYPVVFSVVASWIEKGETQGYQNGKRKEKITPVSWDQLKEIAASGLVEVVPHSYDLHKGIQYNKQGNMAAAGGNLIYDAITDTYESDQEFRIRIARDLARSVRLFKKRLDIAPRVISWPYGKFNETGLEQAKKLGMFVNLSVEDGYADTSEMRFINRGIVTGTMKISEFASTLKNAFIPQEPLRVAQIDLDLIYDEDEATQEKNLGRLLDRLVEFAPNTVFLQTFSDLDGDGNVSEVYFPNSILPVKSDLLNRAAHQIRTRTPVESVFAWAPLLAYQLPDQEKTRRLLVKQNYQGKIAPASGGYQRLSPFAPETSLIISTLYSEMAKNASINGVLFQDDAYLTDFEDFHPEALKAYKDKFGEELNIEKVKGDPEKMRSWTKFKTKKLIDFSKIMSDAVKQYRPNARFARNIYAEPVINKNSQEWYAQNYSDFLNAYDYTVIMAYPFMEKAAKPSKWLGDITNIVASYPTGLQKTVIKIQALDWNQNSWIDEKQIKKFMYSIVTAGAKHIAYYPDNYRINKPDISALKRYFSLKSDPYAPK